MKPVDWSATAAWIALAISIVGTIASPIINNISNHRHQLKLHKLNRENKYSDQKAEIINSFLCGVTKFLSNLDIVDYDLFSESFYCVYQYVPDDMWPELDSLYHLLMNDKREAAMQKYVPIAHRLAEILKDIPQ